MPIYEYQCRRCSQRLEVMQRWSDPPPTECPQCGGELKKLVSAPAFQFKGSGWYVTDYARKGNGSDSAKEGGGGTGDGGGESGSAGGEGSKPAASGEGSTPATGGGSAAAEKAEKPSSDRAPASSGGSSSPSSSSPSPGSKAKD